MARCSGARHWCKRRYHLAAPRHRSASGVQDGENEWADTSMVADDVQVKFKLALTWAALTNFPSPWLFYDFQEPFHAQILFARPQPQR